MQIKFSDFLVFLCKRGTARITAVQRIRDRGPYDVRRDYWKQFRETLLRYHRLNLNGLPSVALLAASGQDPKKRASYQATAEAYHRFVGRRAVTSFAAPGGVWRASDFEVAVNPELGLVVGGRPFILKWHLRADHLDPRIAREAAFLLPHLLRDLAPPRTQFGVLLPTSGTIIRPREAGTTLKFLESEAAAFVQIWNSLAHSRDLAA